MVFGSEGERGNPDRNRIGELLPEHGRLYGRGLLLALLDEGVGMDSVGEAERERDEGQKPDRESKEG